MSETATTGLTQEDVRRLIGDALEYDPHYNVDDVLKEVREGRAYLWLGNSSIAVTTVIETPNGRRCNIWVAAGDMKELFENIWPSVEGSARELGCKSISLTGRRGWVRAMKGFGFKEVATVVAKEL